MAERQRQQAVTLHAVSALRGWFDSSTSHQCLGDAIGRHPRSRAVVLWVRLPSQTPWPAGQTGKGASLRLKRFSRFDSGAGHQVMPAYENRSIGGGSNLRVCRFESDRWYHARVAQSGRGCRPKPGSRAGSNPAARTMGDMTR